MSQENRTRLIRVERARIFVSPDSSIGLDQTNLLVDHMTFRNAIFYWQIHLLEFNDECGDLTVEVIDYNPSSTASFFDQKLKQKINRILFKPFQWHRLEPFLVSYRKEKLSPLIQDSTSELTLANDEFEQKIPFKIRPSFKESRFVSGGVEFNYFIDQINQDLTVRIPNSIIRPEFELIKNFFSKHFKRKTYDVEGEVIIKGSKIDAIATSKQIAKINGEVIQLFKYTQIKELQKPPTIISIDKSLFSTEDIFERYEELPSGNVLDLSERDVLDMMLEHQVVRNKKQLQYLSGKKQITSERLYITLQPLFGFVFFIETAHFIHACWELLNSHATYVWSMDRREYSFDSAKREVESIILSIRQTGRNAYRQSNLGQHADSGIIFNLITHRKADGGIVDPFPKWRFELEEKLL